MDNNGNNNGKVWDVNDTSAKCPFLNGEMNQTAGGGTSNREWWPNQLKLNILRQNSSLTDPMDEGYDYREEFKKLEDTKTNPIMKDFFEKLEGPLGMMDCYFDSDCIQFGSCNIRVPIQRINDNMRNLFSQMSVQEVTQ